MFHVKQWQFNSFNQFSPPGQFSSSFLGRVPSQFQLFQLPVGATVLRTRMQINIGLSVLNQSPSTQDSQADQAAGVMAIFGLWCDPAQGSGANPQPANLNGSSDGHWLQHNMMTLHTLDHVLNGANNQVMTATYKLDAGTSNSQGQRGPALVAGCWIWLVWALVSSFTDFWALNGGNYFGDHTIAWTMSALYDLTPP